MDEAIPLNHPRRFASWVIQWYDLIHSTRSSTRYSTPDQVTIMIICIYYLFQSGAGDDEYEEEEEEYEEDEDQEVDDEDIYEVLIILHGSKFSGLFLNSGLLISCRHIASFEI